MYQFITNNLKQSKSLLEKIIVDQNLILQIEEIVKIMADCIQNGHKIISCGNGGSMSDAMHFAEELTGRFIKNRRALPAIAISDPSHISCVANDYGYQEIFSKYIEAHGNPGDVILGISTSGNSKNVIKAVEMANSKQMNSICLLGRDGGKLKDITKQHFIVPSTTTARIQEIHIKLIHILIEGIERQIFPHLY